MAKPNPTSIETVKKHYDALEAYFRSRESTVGYHLVLGDTRHCGFWEKDTWRMLPLSKALRRMEDKLFTSLGLSHGSRVLDAGCGAGHVALRMASKGLRVTGIDYMKEHLDMAEQNRGRSGLPKDNVTLKKMDFHDLKTLEPGSFDGVYAMETLAHAHDAEKALKEFHRILKPGGKIVLHDYEHGISEETAPHLLRAKEQVTRYGAIPTWGEAKYGYFEERLQRVGFEDVEIHDYSENVRPMLRLFWMMACIPNFFVQLFGLQASFVNTIAGAYMYRGQKYWRYLSISATKKTNKATEVVGEHVGYPNSKYSG